MTGSLLFSPFVLRGVTFRNRVMASPMWQYSGRHFFPTEWHFMHLGRMAAGGSALVMQEGAAVERRGCGSGADLGIWDDRFIAPFRRITDFIRSFGAVPGIQLLHCGRRAKMQLPWGGRKALAVAPEGLDDFDQWDVVGPSAIAQSAEYHTPRALALAEIATIVEGWGSAAEVTSPSFCALRARTRRDGRSMNLFRSFASSKVSASTRSTVRPAALPTRLCSPSMPASTAIRSVWLSGSAPKRILRPSRLG